ncbi:ATP-dependent helicase [Blastococcus sp. Marseille-P5729]|uniref:ATP-dependent helicase n=1 Tax=Blastococcus sp. Marseille-P5729 TaxID=2086582 RepID=UPI000D0FA9A8|nr:ATP-dependent helicase [Blastococcus sp. Marseille-P5729]
MPADENPAPPDPLGLFSPPTRTWFANAFEAPTPAQQQAWQAIARGEHALVVAPTGSGKTLAAFLTAIDRVITAPPPDRPLRRCRVVYLSPLKALAADVERTLSAPLVGIEHAAARLGCQTSPVQVSTRTGDTPAPERRRFARAPGDILITTPESLFLLLTSQAREALRGVETVIVDEIHALAGTKRGAHLALSLERLDDLLDRPAQRIGLSATVRPVDAVAGFLTGAGRPATVVAPASSKELDLKVVVPVEDMADLSDQTDAAGNTRRSIWPAVEDAVYDLVRSHRSTIVFANARRSAERLTARLNERAAHDAGVDAGDAPSPAEILAQSGVGHAPDEEHVIARAHHGSVSREQRLIAEEGLKSGSLPAVVATSSLELGIDMGAVDLVVQVESPPSVASGLQRVGRAGHQVGVRSSGVFFPKHRGDLVSTAVVVERMHAGDLEPLRIPANPLDVLAQQLVAICADAEYSVADLYALVRRAAPYQSLPEPVFLAVLDMLSGRYPSDQFASLRPRLVWDRVTDTVRGRPGAARLAVTSGGTIPDRGLFGVFIAGDERGGRRVGELDEEMVYESRVGDVFLLGTSTWRIVEITHDRVLVVPAPGVPGRMPFWTGEQQGRPLPLGRAIGAFLRELDAGGTPAALSALDDSAVRNLREYVAAQRAATGVVPHDRRIVVERFRDELGDWRVVVHSPFGDQVNAPWSLIIGARLEREYGSDAQAMHGDDGIVLRVPDTTGAPPDVDLITVDPDEVQQLVTEQLMGSALFAARFRECAARALLLPRRDPSRRSPLWQQRQRSAQLLSVAAQYGDFPIVLETLRECLQDVYDVPGLIDLLTQVERRTVTLSEVETASASPFAQSLLFGYVSSFIYQEDVPLAERRSGALSLDLSLLRELLGQVELRELLDPDALIEVEAALQRLTPERAIGSVETLADVLRELGDLTREEIAGRGGDPAWADELLVQRRALDLRIAGEQRLIAIEDAGRYRDALGVALPVGVPEAYTAVTPDPLGDLLGRYARTHAPFTAARLARRLGLGEAVVHRGLEQLVAEGRVTRGEMTPGATGDEWCDVEVLRRIRRRSLARSRAEVEPVAHDAYARFLAEWQSVGKRAHRGTDGVLGVIEQLAGAAAGAAAWESLILPSRVRDYSPAMLDELTAAGEVTWVGAGSASKDGYLRLLPADLVGLAPEPEPVTDPLEQRVLDVARAQPALFFRDLLAAIRTEDVVTPENDIVEALWRLTWAGHLTNDTLAPLRARLSGQTRTRATSRRGRPGRVRARGAAPSPPSVSGRWSLVAQADDDPAAAQLVADVLLERYGVLTRGPVQAEEVPGGFAALYPVLAAYEDAGRVRRGYFVEGLGAAQFATAAAVDRLRASEPDGSTVVLAASDPANPYGAALAWPEGRGPDGEASKHRPARKAGALVVLRDGVLALYVERGGRSLLSFSDDPGVLTDAARSLAEAGGAVGGLHVQRADGEGIDLRGPLATALAEAGFRLTPRGLRLR